MNNGRPLGMRKTVQLLVLLTILAWATQTLFHQWGYGAIIVPSKQALMQRMETATVRTIEVRPEIASSNVQVTLREVCRWSEDDQAALSPYADVIIPKQAGGTIGLQQIQSALRDAGVDLKTIQFSGAATCKVVEGQVLPARTQATAEPVAETKISLQPAAQAPVSQVEAAPTTQPQEEYFEERIVVTRALSNGQELLKSDVAIQRVKLDAPATQPSIAIDDVIGQVAARDLHAGERLGEFDVKAPQAIIAGQFMTVALKIGPEESTVETVAKAMSAGARGETIEAKNEATGEVYNVKITGPNAGTVTSAESNPSNDHGVATTDNGAN